MEERIVSGSVMCVNPCENGEHKAIISSSKSLQHIVHNFFV